MTLRLSLSVAVKEKVFLASPRLCPEGIKGRVEPAMSPVLLLSPGVWVSRISFLFFFLKDVSQVSVAGFFYRG